MLLPGKSPMLPFLKGPKSSEELGEVTLGTSSSWVSSASRRAHQAHDLLEPMMKRPLRGPSGRPVAVPNPAKGGSVPDQTRSQPQLKSLKTSGPAPKNNRFRWNSHGIQWNSYEFHMISISY